MANLLFSRRIVTLVVALVMTSSLGLAANNVDIVTDCIRKNNGDFDAAKACAERSNLYIPGAIPVGHMHAVVNSAPGQQTPAMPNAKQANTVTEHWRINKDVGRGPPEKFNHLFVSPGNDFMFCGYLPMQAVNHKSSWSVVNPNDINVALFTTVGEWLIFDIDVRWLSKEAAGRSDTEIKCEGNGWRMLPSSDNRARYRSKSSCALFVMVCHDEDEYGKRTGSEVCGVCAGFATDF